MHSSSDNYIYLAMFGRAINIYAGMTNVILMLDLRQLSKVCNWEIKLLLVLFKVYKMGKVMLKHKATFSPLSPEDAGTLMIWHLIDFSTCL